MEYSVSVDKLSKKYIIGELNHNVMLREAMMTFFRNTRAQKKEFWALEDISFNIKPGEVVGIIGRNGAGKSTLLKLLSKITYPTLGSLKVHGRIASLLEVGTGFHEELTGRENIFLNGSILGMKKHEISSHLDEIIDFSGVEKFIDTPIKRYSSGMRLRLGFAVAAHLLADVLLIDEVLAVGDAEFQRKCLNAMDRIGNSGRTVLFVSHNMAAVENLCKRAIWIDSGRIRMDGNPKEVISEYLTSYAQSSGTGFDLSALTSRTGNGNIRFTGIEYLNAESESQQLVFSGQPLSIRLSYKVDKPVMNPHFGLEIYTDLGTKITSLSTWINGINISRLEEGCGHIDLYVDALNLIPGRFFISLWIKSVGNIQYDVLDHCAMMNVESSDVHGTGRGMDSKFGIVFFPSTWQLSHQ